jgi:sporulation protein YlmC with PRC-barrel domain
MIGQDQIQQSIGSDMYSSDGDKIGRVGQVYLDDTTGQPQWLTVNTGFFGTNESFVPITEADFSGDRVTVPFSKDRVKDAPNVAADGHISQDEERALYEYYDLDYGTVGT